MSAQNPVLSLVRPEILALSPYSSARKESKGGRIWLDANENPKTPAASLSSEALAKDGRLNLNRYPDPQPPSLVEPLASIYGVAPTQVLVTRGAQSVGEDHADAAGSGKSQGVDEPLHPQARRGTGEHFRNGAVAVGGGSRKIGSVSWGSGSLYCLVAGFRHLSAAGGPG